VNNRLRIEFSAIRIGSTQNYHQIVLTILVNYLLDVFLTLRVKGTGGGSDEALSLHQQRFGTSTLDTFGNRWSLYSITLADDNDPFPFQFHLRFLL
jgi:hypothetical protein